MNNKFLANVEEFNHEFCSIKVGDTPESLSLSFWSYEEIIKALDLRQEWDVSDDLIPFWGDWHDLFCLSLKSGQVLYLNDARECLHCWESTIEFEACLSKNEDVNEKSYHAVGGYLDF